MITIKSNFCPFRRSLLSALIFFLCCKCCRDKSSYQFASHSSCSLSVEEALRFPFQISSFPSMRCFSSHSFSTSLLPTAKTLLSSIYTSAFSSPDVRTSKSFPFSFRCSEFSLSSWHFLIYYADPTSSTLCFRAL